MLAMMSESMEGREGRVLGWAYLYAVQSSLCNVEKLL